MTAFRYEPRVWPAEYQFTRPATIPQQRYLRAVRDNGELTQNGFSLLCKAIMDAYGVHPVNINEGTAFVLIDFFKNAPSKCKRMAERTAWGVA